MASDILSIRNYFQLSCHSGIKATHNLVITWFFHFYRICKNQIYLSVPRVAIILFHLCILICLNTLLLMLLKIHSITFVLIINLLSHSGFPIFLIRTKPLQL